MTRPQIRPGDVVTGDQLRRRESEASFMARVVKLARGAGCEIYHTHDSRHSAKGFPDLIIARGEPPLLLALECKREDGDVTPEQEGWLSLLRDNGVAAHVVRPSDYDWLAHLMMRPR